VGTGAVLIGLKDVQEFSINKKMGVGGRSGWVWVLGELGWEGMCGREERIKERACVGEGRG
jgi:hypothetical protein